MSETLLIQSGLKQADAVTQLLCNFASGYVIKKGQENQERLEMSVTHHLVCADDVNIRVKTNIQQIITQNAYQITVTRLVYM
jgi:hypothetical protein